MPRTTFLFCLLAIAGLTWVSPGMAHAHDGFYLRAGAGLGYYSTSSDDTGEDLGGLTIPLELLLGGTLFPGFVLGGGVSVDYAPSPSYEINGAESAIDISQYLIAIGPFVDFYPDPDAGFHGQLRVGWGGLETSTENGVGGSDPTGLLLTLGGGYDHWVSDTLGIGGLARLTYAPLSLNDASYSTVAFSVLASITYY